MGPNDLTMVTCERPVRVELMKKALSSSTTVVVLSLWIMTSLGVSWFWTLKIRRTTNVQTRHKSTYRRQGSDCVLAILYTFLKLFYWFSQSMIWYCWNPPGEIMCSQMTNNVDACSAMERGVGMHNDLQFSWQCEHWNVWCLLCQTHGWTAAEMTGLIDFYS
jgi:hypothetical protein